MSIRHVLLILFLFVITKSFGQQLKAGSMAPDFSIEDASGKTIQLKEMKGNKVFLAFMRYVSCPACNYRFHELKSNYEKLKSAGYELIVIYESSSELLNEYLSKEPVEFSVVGDPKRKLYNIYGLERSTWKMITSVFKKDFRESRKKGNELYGSTFYEKDGKRNSMPADFLIDENGKISRVYYGKHVSDHLPLIEVISNPLDRRNLENQ